MGQTRVGFAVIFLAGMLTFPSTMAAAAGPPLSIAVSGNHLVNGSGQTIRLLGVNRSGTEYACVQGWGIFDGPNDAPSVAAMATWHINTVRVPLNEDCWLGINWVSGSYSGSSYQAAIESYVSLLHQNGLYAILDLHWNAPGASQSTGQQVMADADHAPAFWKSVATAFHSDPATMFDLYNEPHDVSWSCWLAGCATPGWQTAGMQSLVNAVRSTGATQPILLGGLAWSNDLGGWLANEPADPAHALVASFHNYNFNTCDPMCWDSTVKPLAARAPIVTGELGENDCGHSYIDQYMAWADANGISYLGWTWDTWDCANGPALISDYAGTATSFGIGFKSHLALVANRFLRLAPPASGTAPVRWPARLGPPTSGTALRSSRQLLWHAVRQR